MARLLAEAGGATEPQLEEYWRAVEQLGQAKKATGGRARPATHSRTPKTYAREKGPFSELGDVSRDLGPTIECPSPNSSGRAGWAADTSLTRH